MPVGILTCNNSCDVSMDVELVELDKDEGIYMIRDILTNNMLSAHGDCKHVYWTDGDQEPDMWEQFTLDPWDGILTSIHDTHMYFDGHDMFQYSIDNEYESAENTLVFSEKKQLKNTTNDTDMDSETTNQITAPASDVEISTDKEAESTSSEPVVTKPKKKVTKKKADSEKEVPNKNTDSEKEAPKKKTKKSSTTPEDANGPVKEKKKSPFFTFCNEKRKEVKDKNPEMKHTDVQKELGVMWKQLSAEEQQKYKDM